MRIPDYYLEHRVTLKPIRDVGSSTGALFHPEIRNVKALIADKRTTVVDQRPASETRGEEIIVSGQVVMQKESYVKPGSLVTIWGGTPMEREAEVVAATYADHKRAPSSSTVWIL